MTIANGSNLDATDLLVEHNADGTLKSKDCRVYNSAAITIATATLTAVTFNSERYDTDAIHSTTVNTNRLTCVTAGKYLISADMEFAPNATGTYRKLAIRLNGTTIISLAAISPIASGADASHLSISTIYSLVVGDYVEMMVKQDSGGNLDVSSSPNSSPEFSMSRIGT